MNQATVSPEAESSGGHPFVAWNAAIIRAFFSPAQRDEVVMLSVGPEEIDDLAPELGGYPGLLLALQSGPPWIPNADELGLLGWAERLRIQRCYPRVRPGDYVDPSVHVSYANLDCQFPCYFPVLAALVAINAERSRGDGGFYQRATERLSLKEPLTGAGLAAINELWNDLEAWTGVAGTHGKFGLFHVGHLGGHVHLGQLTAQSVFRSTDAERLGAVFLKLGLRPGQPMEASVWNGVLSAIPEAVHLSRALREAAKNQTYRDVILERARAIFEDWDGQAAPPEANTGSDESEVQHASRNLFESELGLGLELTEGNMPWRIALRIRCAIGEGAVELRAGDWRWSAALTTRLDSVAILARNQNGASGLLTMGADSGQSFAEVTAIASWSTRVYRLKFLNRNIRYLVYDQDHKALVERDGLPRNGGAYLLAAPNYIQLEQLLAQNRIPYQVAPGDGLPAGWRLMFLPDCSRLDGLELADGRADRARSPVVRFVGGVRVRRGGRIQFLQYDLPQIELDAPPHSQLDTPDMEVEEQRSDGERPAHGLQLSSIRRFRIIRVMSELQQFTIRVLDPEQRVLGTLKLRLASSDGIAADPNCPVGLDRWGDSSLDTQLLQGVLVAPAPATVRGFSAIAVQDIGAPITPNSFDAEMAAYPLVRFLDSLAQSAGRMLPYGSARDRLGRYLLAAGEAPRVSQAINDLRRRGFLEVVTDSRGRWVGVSRVPPTLFSLPVHLNGHSVWGVCGTLSFEHWRSLAHGAPVARITRGREDRVPVVRIVGPPTVELSARFRIAERPCVAVAEFSCTLDEFRHRFCQIGYEHLDSRATEIEVFSPRAASWLQVGATAEAGGDWTLLRYSDPETGAHRLNSLKYRRQGRCDFRHVREERWAHWLTYASEVDHAERVFGLVGLAPWPLHYRPRDGALWLPDRMRLPCVLERSLMAASGEGPLEANMRQHDVRNDGKLVGSLAANTLVGPLDPCYELFLPLAGEQIQDTVWLQYRWIPRVLMDELAVKLRCRVELLEEL